jgi:hypothetical protein
MLDNLEPISGGLKKERLNRINGIIPGYGKIYVSVRGVFKRNLKDVSKFKWSRKR